ncbi:hypothetical protein Bca52824_030384 [Brassica carinata]|uniref:Uncharacterized protein n=1 Tax=Brassica carinata TaxID=52824 RepID=A0A8X7S629_BRACI|nr:hypothetical protein Bca52824_030384 [Brassica carinata]
MMNETNPKSGRRLLGRTEQMPKREHGKSCEATRQVLMAIGDHSRRNQTRHTRKQTGHFHHDHIRLQTSPPKPIETEALLITVSRDRNLSDPKKPYETATETETGTKHQIRSHRLQMNPALTRTLASSSRRWKAGELQTGEKGAPP